MNKIFLIFIILLAILLRVPMLDSYPYGFTPDEASFGYDAYSLLHTGRDQWGKWFPLVLESFGDYKAPLYSYLLIPFVAIFGLETWVVRLPNALLGVGAVYITYLLIFHIRTNYLNKVEIGKWRLELFASFLLAISPWHIQLSRGAFEANMTAFFMPLGILLFFEGLKTITYLKYSAIVFGLNLFTYHSARLVTPLVIVTLMFFFLKDIKKVNIRKYILPVCLFSIFLILAFVTLFNGGTKRAQDVSIFRGALEAQADARLAALESGVPPILARLTNNKYLIILDRFKDNYLKYFSKQFFLDKGPAEMTYGMIIGIPVVYSIEVVGFISFIVLMLLYKNKFLFFVLSVILISVIPAALTTGVGYAGNRAATMLPFIHIASTIGLCGLLSFVKKKINAKYLPNILIVGVIFFLLFGLFNNSKTYLHSQKNVAAKSMLFGRIELVKYLESEHPKGGVVISRRLSEPHMYFAFVNKNNPKVYQNNSNDWRRYREEGLTFLDQMYKYSLGRYTFKAIEKTDFDKSDIENIVVVLPDELPENVTIHKTIYYPSGEPAIYVTKI